jgi:hypothetical protein
MQIAIHLDQIKLTALKDEKNNGIDVTFFSNNWVFTRMEK